MPRILLLCWRDSAHPQAGGSERYLETIGAHLAARDHEVHYRTSRPAGAARREARDGVHYSRGGGRFTVYPRALAALAAGRLGLGPLAALGRPDVVIDTQNGVPFFARLVSGAPSIVLVHHCHREQWPVAGWLVGRLGWWIESRLSPRVHARSQYVTVSAPSADELHDLRIGRRRIAVVRNGLDPAPADVPDDPGSDDGPARLVVLSRLVPHKDIEDAIDVVDRLRAALPGLTLDVVGDGWWADQLHAAVRARDLGASVRFHGHVDEARKHEILAAADLHLLPSRKEGWGLAVMEAAQHGVPTLGYRHSGGLRDSVVDGETGVLVGDVDELAHATDRLLADPVTRRRLGEAARTRAATFSWSDTGARMEELVRSVLRGELVSGEVELPGER